MIETKSKRRRWSKVIEVENTSLELTITVMMNLPGFPYLSGFPKLQVI